jgi:NADPH:quinone reductase-like Zn-dependent oxidoreductase
MRAAVFHRYGGPSELVVEQLPMPVVATGEVLLRVRAAVVTAADTAGRSGTPAAIRVFIGLTAPKQRVLGTEFAADVEAIGEGVTHFTVGDAVVGATGASFGAHAEYLGLPETAAMVRKPSNLDHGDAIAVIEGAMTALPFLRDTCRVRAGQRVLVNGASGAVGTAAVQLAKHLGAHVTAVTSTGNLALVRELGADEVIDYTTADFTDAEAAYDVIFDTVGKSSFTRCRRALTRGGVYLTTVPGLPILLQTLITRVSTRRATIAFTGLRSTRLKLVDLAYLVDLAERGVIRPVVHERFALERIAEAHALVDTGHKRGAAVLTL